MDRLKHVTRAFCLFAICILLTGAGCDPQIRAVALHIGDSLMSGATMEIQQIETFNNAAVLPVINAVNGSGLKDNDYWIPRLTNIQARVQPDIVFISLGANDSNVPIEQFIGASGIKDQIDQLLATFSQDTLVYWIIPHSAIATTWNNAEQLGIVNQEILNARDSGEWPNLRVLDFDEWVAAKNLDIATLLSDGIHLNATGRSEWANMIQHTIDVEFPYEPEIPEDPESNETGVDALIP